jgi:hypothetical protein
VGWTLQRIIALLVGEARSLDALRGLWAVLHGYAILAIQGQFQRGGNLESGMLRAVEAYLDGWG